MNEKVTEKQLFDGLQLKLTVTIRLRVSLDTRNALDACVQQLEKKGIRHSRTSFANYVLERFCSENVKDIEKMLETVGL